MARLIQHGEPIETNALPVFIFNHIPKCGGTTFNHILRSSDYGKVLWVHYPLDYLQIRDLTAGSWIITGHSVWGCHEIIPEHFQAMYFCFLREPFKVFLSFYSYLSRKCRISNGLYEFLINDYPHNYLVHRVGNGSLQLAKERLEKTYFLYGLVDHYEDSILLLEQHFPFFNIKGYEKHNVTNSHELIVEQKIREYFIKYNNLDNMLYDWAKDLFFTRLRERNTEFDRGHLQIKDIVSTPNREELANHLKKENYQEAAQLFDDRQCNYESPDDIRLHADLAKKMNDYAKTENILLKGNELFPYTMSHDLFQLYQEMNAVPQKFIDMLEKQLSYWNQLATDCSDSYPNVQKQNTLFLLGKAYRQRGESHKGMQLLEESLFINLSNQNNLIRCLYFMIQNNYVQNALSILDSLPLPEDLDELMRRYELEGMIYDQLGDYGAAEEKYQRAYRLGRLTEDVWRIAQRLVVMWRKAGAFENALNILQDLLKDPENIGLSELMAKELAVTHYEYGDHDAAYKTINSFSDVLMDGYYAELISTNHVAYDFSNVFSDIQTALVIRTAPMLVFDYFINNMKKYYDGNIDILSPPNEGLDGFASDRLHTYYKLPPKLFCFDSDIEYIDTAIFNKNYGVVVVLLSSHDMRGYNDIFRLIKLLKYKLIMSYSLCQLYAQKYKETLIPLTI